jgi:peptide/nickel transport system substrate-binding protein
VVVLASVALVLVACTGTITEEDTSITSRPWHGGTLRIGVAMDRVGMLDPQRSYWFAQAELFRCCLVRTLFSYLGVPTQQGGAELRPDLAASMPEVSEDGLTWTFRLRRGIRYGPPFQDTEIVAGDIVRALMREADPRVTSPEATYGFNAGYPFYFSIIEGFDDVRAVRASSIHGLETPDPHTLIVRLTEPSGDLPYRFTLAATAPIPEGAAEGHRDYGRFLVASGPYMFEGSEDLDFSLPPEEQTPVSGYIPSAVGAVGPAGKTGSATLVRNPAWDPSTDDLRPAYVDRIEVEAMGDDRADVEAFAQRVDSGDLDLVLSGWPPLEQVERYRSDPALTDRLLRAETNTIYYLEMYVANPPFDDPHVRKSVMFLIDRAEIVHRINTSRYDYRAGELAPHIAPDSLEGGLLSGYDPYPNHAGDPAAARAEMARSRYDRDGDGRCDDPVCRGVVAVSVASNGPDPDAWDVASLVRRDLGEIGIRLRLVIEDFHVIARMVPAGRAAISVWGALAWGTDYLNGSSLFFPLFSSKGDAVFIAGASPEQIASLGVDRRIDRCLAETGQDQVRCWAELDQYLMEEVVPWIPLMVQVIEHPISARVDHASIDQFTTMPALDRIALEPGSE